MDIRSKNAELKNVSFTLPGKLTLFVVQLYARSWVPRLSASLCSLTNVGLENEVR